MNEADDDDDNLPLAICDFPGCKAQFQSDEGAIGPDFAFCPAHAEPGVIR